MIPAAANFLRRKPSDFFFIQAKFADEMFICPKMTTPISAFQIMMLNEWAEFYGAVSFQKPIASDIE